MLEMVIFRRWLFLGIALDGLDALEMVMFRYKVAGG